ncbi:lipid IV(A) 3-deoxy-D-manno-octulosonic acid transferase [Massilia pseudoviolaceinigra]|uniref:lipid IV(A) 3-deoxy-D-manno-octulosonic acid transferase n=1 Tax=Massilia pseudoviolaceinigra TaxID=3057165 RepID=UPI002796BA52|nr:lipid IV(A) 3-deoxy-D-manno-octulosonic acid transferase [Massilia sp. CCM 9206]MDQ1919878.1 lipid IV(A) 3-deoxy-D-manno-octulosonic acid transferase [Massilia sp. CCM 9206]
MRTFYSVMWYLALPLVLGRLWWRGFKEPGYRQHWRERLGFYGGRVAGWHTIWVHAVSVGETRAAEPLIDALVQAYPDSRILLTHMTPTGRATGRALFSKHGERLIQAYLPYDTVGMVNRFIRQFTPRICILMETEVWPNLIATCGERIPVALVNARLSERSLRRGQRFGKLMTDAGRGIALVAAQTEADAARLRSFGAPNVEVTGSIKFDVVVPDAALETGAWLRARIGERPVLLCASTRDGEEALILDAFEKMAPAAGPAPLLVIVPRHPQRFDDVAALVRERGFSLRRRSAIAQEGVAQLIDTQLIDTQVLLGDSMGEMFAYYAACDVAFVGGSLLPLGGQNLIEPCALGKPVLVGPHTFNFALATEDAIADGGAIRVPDASALLSEAACLLADPSARAAMGQHAAAYAQRHRGATARTVGLLRRLIY